MLIVASSALAKTPDGVPPSEETVCSDLSGAAFGLCNAYCEAQDCDVHARPSCSVLRKNFKRITGNSVFPCDRACGDGTIQRGEDCDPPESECPDGRLCKSDCTCPDPGCGDAIIDPGEDCDPPGSPCAPRGTACTDDCTCVTEPLGCCECAPAANVRTCRTSVSESDCLSGGATCTFVGAPATGCNNVPVCARTNCCLCDQMCTTIVEPFDTCPNGCVAVPAPSACDSMGNCQSFPVLEP